MSLYLVYLPVWTGWPIIDFYLIRSTKEWKILATSDKVLSFIFEEQ